MRSAVDLCQGQFMWDVVEELQALVNYIFSAFFKYNHGFKLFFGGGVLKLEL